MEDLPKRIVDRVIGESYLHNGEVIIWDGKYLRCEHGRRRSQCKDCGGGSICEHGRIRSRCKDCGGSSICEHGRVRSQCKDCGGSSICEHGRERSLCKDCGGSSICEHGRQRRKCKICDPHGHFRHLISKRIRTAIINNGDFKFKTTLELLGCSVADARIHIESQFYDGMSWENIGEWHIDHRRPCASFDLTLESDQKMCFHYSNLQPMWASENISKQDSFDEENFEWEWDGSQWIEKV